jgi:hypothetical protein
VIWRNWPFDIKKIVLQFLAEAGSSDTPIVTEFDKIIYFGSLSTFFYTYFPDFVEHGTLPRCPRHKWLGYCISGCRKLGCSLKIGCRARQKKWLIGA